ncbi:MAG TPA: SDR family NAD(P)-dependent oxidoreductase [Acidimicrobiales bacterium]|nr:SDR family NAD(P)-dependent oxidoreductase [Acidimicrobiales bacterium]
MRVLVTGAARAIGRATVEVLTARGHEVVATARDVSLLEGAPAALILPLDVTDPSSISRALGEAGELAAVVNNAALTGFGPMETYPIESFRHVLDVNTLGPLRMAQAVVPGWRARGSGVLVNISSIQGKIGTPLEGAYAASKHALEAMSESMHVEFGHFGIRVVVIEPGYIAPGMKHEDDHVGPAAYADLHAQWRGAVTTLEGPEGRPGPELVAAAVADALEDPDTPLRVEVGADAAMVLELRRTLRDPEFEATMREGLGLTW